MPIRVTERHPAPEEKVKDPDLAPDSTIDQEKENAAHTMKATPYKRLPFPLSNKGISLGPDAKHRNQQPRCN
jgi:hypothetical protein